MKCVSFSELKPHIRNTSCARSLFVNHMSWFWGWGLPRYQPPARLLGARHYLCRAVYCAGRRRFITLWVLFAVFRDNFTTVATITLPIPPTSENWCVMVSKNAVMLHHHIPPSPPPKEYMCDGRHHYENKKWALTYENHWIFYIFAAISSYMMYFCCVISSRYNGSWWRAGLDTNRRSLIIYCFWRLLTRNILSGGAFVVMSYSFYW